MQDTGPSVEQNYLAKLMDELPAPAGFAALPVAGANRFSLGGLTEARTHYAANGVGMILEGQAQLLSPEMLDEVWHGLAVANPDEQVIALTATSLGAVVGLSLDGNLILVDPLDGSIHVVRGQAAAENPTAFQIRMVEEIGALELQLASDDPHVDLNGDPLHEVLQSRLGPLVFGECYGATLSIENDRFYDSTTWAKQSLPAYILGRHSDDPFDRTDFDA